MEQLMKLIEEAIKTGDVTEDQLKEVKKAIDAEVNTKADELADIKSQLREEDVEEQIQTKIAEKIEELKAEITKDLKESSDKDLERFSDFVNQVVEEIIEGLEEDVLRYAKIGENYEDIVEDFKERIMIESGVIPQEVTDLMGESKTVIETLETQQDELVGENLDLKSENDSLKNRVLLLDLTKDLDAKLAKIVVEHFDGSSEDEINENIDGFVKTILSLISENATDADADDKDADVDNLDEDDKDAGKDTEIENDVNPVDNKDENKTQMDKYIEASRTIQ